MENELVEIVDYLKDPAKYRRLGAKLPKGRPARRPSWHRQDAAGQGGRR
ncbi:hypothetical protein [Nonomuraea dietziae]